MGRIILAGVPEVEIRLRRSAQARRLSLRVSQLDGRVTITLPRATPRRKAEAFAHEKEAWIRRNLASCPGQIRPMAGARILWQGHEIPIVAGSGRSARLKNGELHVPPDPTKQRARIAAFLKNAARARLVQACESYAAELGCRTGQISLRDTRSRWGSCSAQGNLMFSWRLIMAPAAVLDYVAAHEVAHLVEMNHSPAYWAVVARIFPQYRQPRQWLRQNGTELHRYNFTD